MNPAPRRLHEHVSNTHHWQPAIGRDAFTQSQALTDLLWDQLTTENWHYTNFTSQSSCWESRQDGSMVYLHYSASRVAELSVTPGAAAEVVAHLAPRFHLVPTNPHA